MRKSLARRYELPREHGAWGMLGVSFFAGVLIAGRPGWPTLGLAFAAFLAFSSRESLLQSFRLRARGRSTGASGRLALAKLSLMAVAGLLLFVVGHLWGLLAPALLAGLLGVVHLRQALAGQERTLSGQLVAIAAISLAAPSAHYVARGTWELQAVAIWLLCCIYFASSVFYLKVRVGSVSAKRQQALPRVRRHCAAYHFFLGLLVLTLAVRTPLGPPLALAYVAVLARATWYLLRPGKTLNLKQIGYLEVAYSMVFLAFLVVAMRSA